MKMHDAFKSDYIKSDELKDGEKTYVIAGVAEDTVGQGADAETKPVATLEDVNTGEEKKFVIGNKVNWTSIVEITGEEDSDDWTGSKITLYRDPNITFGGKKVGGIRIKAPTSAGATTPPAGPAPGTANSGAANELMLQVKKQFKEQHPGLEKAELIAKFNDWVAMEFDGRKPSDLTANEWQKLDESFQLENAGF